MGFQLLRRAGYDESFVAEVARVMEYTRAYEAYRDDREEVRSLMSSQERSGQPDRA